MDSEAVPAALRERLGPEATTGLLDLLHSARLDWRDDVIAACGERFERRLAAEMSGLRLEITQGDAALRQEMTELGASLRQDMKELGAGLRQEMTELGASLRQEMTELGASLRQETTQLGASLRQEMTELGASLRQETAQLGASLRQESAESAATLRQEIAGLRTDMWAGRVELLKWCFVFWVGQVVAVAGVLAVMLRLWRT
jgi:DNA anti-recombination protein RmuC